ncbi:MAG: hypothetical protein KZQ66_03650 [Candidatus Thiodiazotropha sp. (ex Lucinoma aequizonata)]|nr:hypothetical protein [Candidatus Thiodiazotropha sp. (ex Lucinoma aequizonata)]MCU7889918.1 hypothetical protein [Candidatus Thiodiazotropha sp. (ex Lucinoma aequizonata)]MCU7894421.1 hypothetical protein [Candidatus Thiodiazotropha sp. (ex Lucinoma aequizonata)]MCU7899807.1 hypothetical protein [Candidatus Thiodiazotropha sp. (ex Lucinoma aequizonata)]MCU7901209.1 hypothetical protein [Candidatus Thiodiazotropha sp. (ex Lucinoma aequizonata)]
MSWIFLLLNASVVWAVIAGLLVWLLRSKTLLLVLLIAPVVIAYSFQEVAGVAELVKIYITSLVYGCPGVIIGTLYADYRRTMALLVKMSALSMLGRAGVTFSSVYLLSYYGHRIIFDNPLVATMLNFIEGGNTVKSWVSQIDETNVTTAYVGIALSIGLILFGKYKYRLAHTQLAEPKEIKNNE